MLVIINCLIKIIYYKLIKTIINITGLAKVIKNRVIKHHDLLKLIVVIKSLCSPRSSSFSYTTFLVLNKSC